MERRPLHVPLGMLWMVLRPHLKVVDGVGSSVFFNLRIQHNDPLVREHIEDVADLVVCLEDPFTAVDVLDEVQDEVIRTLHTSHLIQNWEVVHTELVTEIGMHIQQGLDPALPDTLDLAMLDDERLTQLIVWKRWQLWLAQGLN